MLHKMKTGGLKMLKKGPNFKNFPGLGKGTSLPLKPHPCADSALRASLRSPR